MTDRLRLGAAYYPEYLPPGRLDTDLDLMAEAGLRIIRVGESVWSTWEPAEGDLRLDWLQPVLDGAAARGIDAVVGTPTYAIPPWLAAQEPDALAQNATGSVVGHGGRQNADLLHPGYRAHAERIIRAVVSRYADHPAVVGWQVDNEPGAHLLHNPGVLAGFVEHLKRLHGTPEALNEAWGLVFWSHRITDFDQLWRPDSNTVPSYDLAWRRYQDELVTGFIAWQAGIVHELARPDQFVTTCIAGHQPAADAWGLARALDRTAVNLYYATQDALGTEPAPTTAQGSPWWEDEAGEWRLHQAADTARGLRDEPFLVTETNAVSIGLSEVNNPPYPGQRTLAALTMLLRGATTVEYWHWHSLHFGAETHWGGILNHRLELGRAYREIAGTARAASAAEDVLAGLRPDEDVLLVTCHASRRALEFQPPLTTPGNTGPDRNSHGRIVDAFYRAFHTAGAQLAVHDVRGLPDAAAMAKRWPVVLAPALYAATDAQLDLLLAYARAGGRLVLGPRTGYADELARARSTRPELLRAAGVDYDESSALAAPLAVAGALSGAGAAWADLLEPTADDTEVLASWTGHPFFSAYAAVTDRPVGAGRITTVATLPDQALGRALARRLLGQALPDLPAGVTRATARTAAGERVALYANWSWEPASVTVHAPHGWYDLAGDRAPGKDGDTLGLGPWGHRLVVLRTADAPAAGHRTGNARG
ncbi:beta-galactosidase [Streptacidiphilus sp. ASG 303]|uniref:beta-galactosidase n=1 Tax=Streptacidiphilus sp. ASG 303 TaxID=2896847 RepID=UPI001E4B97DC|nr:beta-galactosidase [Streptacidiphilus sp. ASG 303]MCD0483571.1 beta-galactosidase [Streptacidiphilus sp. ASG 303]